MFYSETLLSKTGPLARVWLSANLERKLSKTHILQSNIESSVHAIVDQGQAPMALRLSGQLLLGVVRIYSRKARYLLDDCNEALMKIKMAFRPGNVDLPANQMNAPNAAALTLPDVLTELDLLPPMPDASLLLTQPSGSAAFMDMDRARIGRNEDITLMDPSSPLVSNEIGLDDPGAMSMLDDVPLDIDIGEDPIEAPGDGTSIEIGRREPSARPVGADLIDDDFGLDKDADLDMGIPPDEVTDLRDQTAGDDFHFNMGQEDDMILGGNDEYAITLGEPVNEGAAAAPTPGRLERDSQSPLSSLGSADERRLAQDSHLFHPEEEEDESMHLPHRAKKRKILQPDTDTILHGSLIKHQQEDRSRILKPASFLPRDPMLMTLMAMQRNGGFVSSILGDGRSKGWAPELKGILSLEVVRRSGELKRKRDSGVADLGDSGSEKGRPLPQLELGEEDETIHLPEGGPMLAGDQTVGADEEIIHLPPSDGIRPGFEDQDEEARAQAVDDYENVPFSPGQDRFDETTAPLLHPADSGPISLGTKHAVHLLREQFGSSPSQLTASPSSQSSHLNKSITFQDLLPPTQTSKADATKMFFEVLVLATKDAVKVEQKETMLGAPIRVRGKRGLWGDWAEKEAGGEIATQEEGVVA
ncbi:MAG: sister chromatid cohesion protein 1 [Caeruleum heppii]|nr:MAG: sister chromatid cohesion protein 1 [Caeruleum heppii]